MPPHPRTASLSPRQPRHPMPAVLAVAVVILLLAGCGRGGAAPAGTSTAPPSAAPPVAADANRDNPTPAGHLATAPTPVVGLRRMTLVDPRRRLRLPGGRTRPRTLPTLVRYPATGPPSRGDEPNAAPARRGPYPLIVFGHGFAVTPAPYARLLRAWVRAGYVVAAPVFPLENANAPGGPDENDLVNQPADMSLVITRLLTADRVPHGALSGLIDPRRIAVAGQSDGGETALAVAYDSHFFDRRVGAAVILSGAKIPGIDGFTFPAPAPPLLATQGTADTINPPHFTSDFYNRAPDPKFLLRLLGAGHQAPYADQQPQLGIVARVSAAFLDRYLKGSLAAGGRLRREGAVPGVATLSASP